MTLALTFLAGFAVGTIVTVTYAALSVASDASRREEGE